MAGQPSTGADGSRLEITQVRSIIGSRQRQRQTLRSLGIRRMRQTVVQPDRPEIRGMVAKVAHLVEVRYAGDDVVLDVEPGQEPKGEGNPPAGASVEDSEAADLRAAQEEALAVSGSTEPGDLVQNPPSLTSTDAPDAPKAPSAPADEDEAEAPTPEPLGGSADADDADKEQE